MSPNVTSLRVLEVTFVILLLVTLPGLAGWSAAQGAPSLPKPPGETAPNQLASRLTRLTLTGQILQVDQVFGSSRCTLHLPQPLERGVAYSFRLNTPGN